MHISCETARQDLEGHVSISIGNVFPGTFDPTAVCISAMTLVIMGSLMLETLLPNPIIDTTLVAYRSNWATY